MATSHFVGEDNQYTLTVEQDVIDVTPMSEPDPNWEYTDSAGHVHRYIDGEGVPSVKSALVGHYWCEDCHETHEEWDTVCCECGESITPGTRPATWREFQAGATHVHGSMEIGGPWWDVLAETITTGKPIKLVLGPFQLSGVLATAIDGTNIRFVVGDIRPTST